LPTNISFPNLKDLDIRGDFYSTRFTLKAIEDAENLEKLSIVLYNLNDALVNCILNKKSLKELNLSENFGELDRFFRLCPVQNAKFKLTSLTLGNMKNRFDPQTKKKFNKFMFRMAETRFPEDIEFVMNRLNALKSLEINGLFLENPNDLSAELKPNISIIELKCRNSSDIPAKVFELLVSLEVLKVNFINSLEFTWIVKHVKGLKKLHTENWNFGQESPEDFYNKLNKTDPNVNGNIEIINAKF
jgi:hypothetical protein